MSVQKYRRTQLLGVIIVFTLGVAQCNRTERNLDFEDIGIEGFTDELFFAEQTPRTAKFNDYTEGSYHIESLALYNHIANRVNRTGEPAKKILVLGPSGALWTYYIFLFSLESNQIQVNFLVSAHARIKAKGTAILTREEYHLWMRDIENKGSLKKFSKDNEYDGNILLGTFGSEPETLSGSTHDLEPDETREFSKAVDRLIDRLEFTYDISQ